MRNFIIAVVMGRDGSRLGSSRWKQKYPNPYTQKRGIKGHLSLLTSRSIRFFKLWKAKLSRGLMPKTLIKSD